MALRTGVISPDEWPTMLDSTMSFLDAARVARSLSPDDAVTFFTFGGDGLSDALRQLLPLAAAALPLPPDDAV